jgi:hypothetical protein
MLLPKREKNFATSQNNSGNQNAFSVAANVMTSLNSLQHHPTSHRSIPAEALDASMHVATVSLRSKLSIPSTLDVFGISSTPNSSGRVSNTTASLRHGSQGGIISDHSIAKHTDGCCMIDPTTAISIRGLRTKPIWIKPEIESAVDRLGSTRPRPILHVVDAPVASIHHTFEVIRNMRWKVTSYARSTTATVHVMPSSWD